MDFINKEVEQLRNNTKARFSELEMRMNRFEDNSSGGGSTRATAAAAGHSSGWIPRWIEFKNFCSFNEKDTKGIPKAEAHTL
eukprot:7000163-Lingulodinium_polyedra.AAC.1